MSSGHKLTNLDGNEVPSDIPNNALRSALRHNGAFLINPAFTSMATSTMEEVFAIEHWRPALPSHRTTGMFFRAGCFGIENFLAMRASPPLVNGEDLRGAQPKHKAGQGSVWNLKRNCCVVKELLRWMCCD
jgi:hypothetical protein